MIIRVLSGIVVAAALFGGTAPANAIPKCAVQSDPSCRGYQCFKYERCTNLAGWVINGCTRLICTKILLPFNPQWLPQPGPKVKNDWIK